MYNICEEKDEPLDINSRFIEGEDEITIEPCPCTQEGKTLELHVPYASAFVEFHWKHKQIEYWGDYGGLIKIRYCPFCGRKL